MKGARDRRFQAVYPLKGKPLNTIELDAGRAMENQEISDLAVALGTGLLLPDQEITGLRYHMVIVMADADADGGHIKALLITHFTKHLLPLVLAGHLYLALPPLYKVGDGRRSYTYLKDESELSAFYAERARKAGIRIIDGGGNYDDGACGDFASRAPLILTACEEVAAAHGFWPGDVSHASTVVNEGMDPAGLAEAIAERRRLTNAEAVRCESTEESSVVSGLQGGEFFVTVVDWAFLAAAAAVKQAAEEAMGLDLSEAAAGFLWVQSGSEQTPYDPLSAARLLDEAARRGTNITRLKGLGEMLPTELRDTTVSKNNRRLVRVTIEDLEADSRTLESLFCTAPKFIAQRREILELAKVGQLDV